MAAQKRRKDSQKNAYCFAPLASLLRPLRLSSSRSSIPASHSFFSVQLRVLRVYVVNPLSTGEKKYFQFI